MVKKGTLIGVKCGPFVKGVDRKYLQKERGWYTVYFKDGTTKEKVYYPDLGKLKNIKMLERHEKRFCHICKEKEPAYGTKKSPVCSDCRTTEPILAKRKTFPSNLNIDYAYKTGMNINMFMFKETIKISGYKRERHAYKMLKRFFSLHINPKFLITTDNIFKCRLESVMINASFPLKNRYFLEKICKHVFLNHQENLLFTCYDSSIDNSVPIQIEANPKTLSFFCFSWDGKKFTESIETVANVLEDKRTSLEIYNNSFKISARFIECFREMYEFADRIVTNPEFICVAEPVEKMKICG